MSGSVEMRVELDSGASMGFERDSIFMGQASPERVLAELDRGYRMLRDWLLSQTPPSITKPQVTRPPLPERR